MVFANTSNLGAALSITPSNRISQILEDDSLDLENSDLSKCEVIEQLIPELGWLTVYAEMISILEDQNQCPRNWHTAAEVLWGAVLDKRDLSETGKLIALLYLRLGNSDGDENLAWSITSELKGVSYLSSYDPMKDPEVVAEITRLNKR